MRTYYGKAFCRAASFKVRELICPCIALAADLDGTFAVARMQPVSRGRCRSLQSWRPVRGAAFHVGAARDLWLLDCGPWSALRCWYMPRGEAVAPDRRAPLRRAVAQQDGSF